MFDSSSRRVELCHCGIAAESRRQHDEMDRVEYNLQQFDGNFEFFASSLSLCCLTFGCWLVQAGSGASERSARLQPHVPFVRPRLSFLTSAPSSPLNHRIVSLASHPPSHSPCPSLSSSPSDSPGSRCATSPPASPTILSSATYDAPIPRETTPRLPACPSAALPPPQDTGRIPCPRRHLQSYALQ